MYMIAVRNGALLCLAAALVAGCGALDKRQFSSVIATHMTRYPIQEVQDLYKFVWQAAMGDEFWVADSSMAVRLMMKDLRGLPGPENEWVCDPVSPHGGLVRVNFRQTILIGQDADALVRVYEKSSRSIEPSVAKLERYWGYAESMALAGALPYTLTEMQAYFKERAVDHHSPVTHSSRYGVAYRPAYRVMRRSMLPFKCQ